MAWTPGNTDTAMAAGGGIIGSVISGLFGNRQARLNRESQQAENQKERDFNAEQAELSRQWQEKMYNLHESPQAQAQALRQAGIALTDGIQNMSVGSASTASGGGSALPAAPSPWTGVGDAIGAGLSQLPFVKEQIKQAKLQTALQQEQLTQQISETLIKQLEAANTPAMIDAALREANERVNGLVIDNKSKEHLREMNEIEANKAREAYDAGINERVDAHNESVARIKKIVSEIESIGVDNEVKRFALSLSKKFDEAFLNLDLQARQKEVEEFLETSDVRLSLYNAQVGFARLAMNAAERADALEKLTNEYEVHIAEQILDAAKDGKTSLDAVFMKYFAEDPGATLSALSGLIDVPTINNNNYSKTIVR